MFLQILPPDEVATSVFDSQLLFVLLALTIGVFVILRLIKYLSKIKLAKNYKNPSYTS